MMHALERYEPRPGIPFFAYAAPYIRAAMAKEATFSLSIVDIPERHLRDARAGQMDADAAALVHESRYVTDIDDLHEVTPSSSAVTAETALSQKQISAQLRHHFRQALEQLSKEEAEVIRWRAAGGGEIRTLAERLDITADKVRKIEFRAMARMKSFLLRQGVTPHILNTAT